MSSILTLEQLQSITNAFDGFVTVKDSDLPEYYKEVFGLQCVCGGETILTKNTPEQSGYTQLQCCNPDCWIKMAHRFAYFVGALGYKGFGSTTALSLYEQLHTEFKYPSFLCIFDVEEAKIRAINGHAYADAFIQLKQDLQTKGFQFKDAIAALGIPNVGKGSALFDVVKSPVVLLDFLRMRKLDELCNMAGINALQTRYYLDIHKVDIVTLMCDVMPNILSTPKSEIHLAITGSVTVNGRSLTRAEFIALCEQILDENGTQKYKLVETKSASKLDYVIADAPSSSSKYALGLRLNKLITADQFYKLLTETEGN